jgi:hypothetical protein
MDLNQYIAARIVQADLIAVDTHFSKVGISDMDGIICLKSTLVAIANLLDFERTIRILYKDHRDVSKVFKRYEKNYEFAKYLRNKFVGHIHPELIKKAIEWKPELRSIARKMDDQKLMILINIFILETTINTYVDDDERNKFFETETDLMYPPDWKRFLNFLEISVRSAIAFLKEVCALIGVLPVRLHEIF